MGPLEHFKNPRNDSYPAQLLDIASILLTKDSIFFGVGYALEDYTPRGAFSQVFLSSVYEVFGATKDNDLGRYATVPDDFNKVMKHIFELAPNVSHICVASFGPYKRVGKKYRSVDKDYGVLKHVPNYPGWSGKRLYKIARDAAAACHRENAEDREARGRSVPKILIALDVNVSALGEHYHLLERRIEQDQELSELKREASSKRSRGLRYNRESKQIKSLYKKYHRDGRGTTAYLKISNSVNVGFTTNGWISGNRGYSQFNAFKPRRNIVRNDFIDNDVIPGFCPIRSDSIEGLVSMPALIKRIDYQLKRDGRPDPLNLQSADLEDLLRLYPLDSRIWAWTARYIADLAYHVSFSIVPERIALGGLVLTGPKLDRTHGWSELIEKIKDQYLDLFVKTTSADTFEMNDHFCAAQGETFESSYLSYRRCNFPAIFGGLIAARWDKHTLYPLPVEDMFDRRKED